MFSMTLLNPQKAREGRDGADPLVLEKPRRLGPPWPFQITFDWQNVFVYL